MNISASVMINTSPENVFNFVADIENETRWRENTIAARFVENKDLNIGTVGESIITGKENIQILWEVFQFEENHVIRWNLLSGPLDGTGGYIVEPVENGTRFTLEAKIRMKGFKILMSPVIYFIAKKMNSNSVLKLKGILESK